MSAATKTAKTAKPVQTVQTPLIFKGVAHGPGSMVRKHPADLSGGELAALEGSALNGLPIHVEHDTSMPAVGNVLASYEGPRGELRVIGQVNDQATAKAVLDGSMRGLSLGTDCVQTMDGNVLGRSQRELSLCEEGRRTGTWITDINNQTVHTVACFSKNSNGVCPLPAIETFAKIITRLATTIDRRQE